MTYCPNDQSTRRAELAQSLQGRGHHLSLAGLLRVLGLKEAFSKYMASTSGMLFPVAQLVPALVNGQLQARVDGGQVVDATSASLARAFRDIWDYVGHAGKAVYPVAELASEYRFSDQRTMRVGGVPVKPDGVFYYPMYLGSEFHSVHALLEAQLESNLDATSPDVLGKMADLAVSAWEAQPTRLFVPFLYLHGPDVSLVLFARSGYYCTTIGRLFHTSRDPSTDDTCDVEDTLRYLWFLMTLPSDRFGHIVDVSSPDSGLRFSKARGVSVAVGRGNDSAVDFQQRIPLPVSLFDFQSYIFRMHYHGQPAMLKLVWSPTCRLPEAVMYDWLLNNGCNAVPKVYESLVIADDVFGYRLEVLLIEDCGMPLLEYFKAAHGNVSDTSRRDADAEGIFKQLASCLAVAHSAGVIHCDVSAEHIAVRGGHAFIFDWTRAQLTTSELPARMANMLKLKCGLNAYDLQPLRWPKDDPVVQTAIYAGIRSLWHDCADGLVDGFESLFYVILHALFHSNFTLVGAPSAFEELSVSAMALIKTGCVADPDMYPSYFGIADIGDGLKAFLDKVRVFLFCADGIFVGGKLVDSGFERSVRPELAKAFLFEKAFAAAYLDDVKPGRGSSVGPGTAGARSFSLASCAHLFPPKTMPSATRGAIATVPAASATTTSVATPAVPDATPVPAVSAKSTSAPAVPATATAPASAVPATTAAPVVPAPTVPATAPAKAIAVTAPAPAVPVTASASAVPISVTKTSVHVVSATAPAPAVSVTESVPAVPVAPTSAAPTVTATTVSASTAIPVVRPDSAINLSSTTTTTASATSAVIEPNPKNAMKELAKAARDAREALKASKATASAATAPASTSAAASATSAPAALAFAAPVTTNPLSVFGTSALVAPVVAPVKPAVAPLFGSVTPKPVYSFGDPSYFVPPSAPVPGFRLGEKIASQATDTWVFGSKPAAETSSVIIGGTSYLYFGSKSKSNSEPAAAPAAVASTSAAAKPVEATFRLSASGSLSASAVPAASATSAPAPVATTVPTSATQTTRPASASAPGPFVFGKLA
ncbi:hypothetical protein GGH94_004007 [Coemansia aciculifera]|uniref:Protein kinase domain-containing protein n=1 Tax=Coemansia aciculifera TaxID=417176 RepID=A0A9W8M585_9FUNG|nr:hypothetical protein GGH94_004007 [Coemansia aciculifera]